MQTDKQEKRIKRGHVALMKHPETALYSGVMLMGNSMVLDEGCPTAYTDGINKFYGRKHLETIPNEAKLRGLILHENLHVALKHCTHGAGMFRESANMANLAADFVVNDITENIKGTIAGTTERIVELYENDVYDPMFHNWSMREVYNYLKKHAKPKPKPRPQNGDKPCDNPTSGGGNDKDNTPPNGGEEPWESVEVNGKTYDLSRADEHRFGGDMTHEQAKEVNDAIDRALREGGLLAGRMGGKIPRSIAELLEPKIDWRDALREFVMASIKGKDEFTWRKLNKRHLANDIIMPCVENETIGELIVAIDTSGSIGQRELSEFATELVSICEVAQPEKVRVLWWDTEVHGEQVFNEGDYKNIASMLKPLGGGGTYVSSVSAYINKEKLKAECVLVFTDGYVESDIAWNITSPTLWMITSRNDFVPPSGKAVKFDNE